MSIERELFDKCQRLHCLLSEYAPDHALDPVVVGDAFSAIEKGNAMITAAIPEGARLLELGDDYAEAIDKVNTAIRAAEERKP